MLARAYADDWLEESRSGGLPERCQGLRAESSALPNARYAPRSVGHLLETVPHDPPGPAGDGRCGLLGMFQGEEFQVTLDGLEEKLIPSHRSFLDRVADGWGKAVRNARSGYLQLSALAVNLLQISP